MNVKLLSPDAQLPKRASKDAAGYDLYASGHGKIPAGERSLIPLDIAIEIPTGCFGMIKSRSGNAVKGIDVQAGVIDSDYRGNVKVLLHNTSPYAFSFQRGDRIAQLIILKHESPEIVEVADLSSTLRNHGGFGSTGVNVIRSSMLGDAPAPASSPKRQKIEAQSTIVIDDDSVVAVADSEWIKAGDDNLVFDAPPAKVIRPD